MSEVLKLFFARETSHDKVFIQSNTLHIFFTFVWFQTIYLASIYVFSRTLANTIHFVYLQFVKIKQTKNPFFLSDVSVYEL